MNAADWLNLDEVLGFVECVFVPASVIYLLIAIARGGRRRVVRALVLATLLALTVAQPFGVKGVPMSPEEFAAGDAMPAESEAVHSVRVLGVPLFGFRPYTRGIVYVNGESGYPDDWLKVRSWLWPGILTNGEKVERLCGNTSQPCWVPEDQSQSGFGRSSNLELVRAGAEWRYRILTHEGRPPNYPGPRDGTYAYNGYYRLTVGLVSLPGLMYWLVVATLAVRLIRRLRVSATSEVG